MMKKMSKMYSTRKGGHGIMNDFAATTKGESTLTIWRNGHLAGSMQPSERQDHQDLGTMTHRWNQQGVPNPVVHGT